MTTATAAMAATPNTVSHGPASSYASSRNHPRPSINASETERARRVDQEVATRVELRRTGGGPDETRRHRGEPSEKHDLRALTFQRLLQPLDASTREKPAGDAGEVTLGEVRAELASKCEELPHAEQQDRQCGDHRNRQRDVAVLGREPGEEQHLLRRTQEHKDRRVLAKEKRRERDGDDRQHRSNSRSRQQNSAQRLSRLSRGKT